MITTIEQTLHSEIPLTTALGIRVKEYTSKNIRLTAPLENNINHKNTAFGGSLYSICVLTGWSLIFGQMLEHNLDGHIVIQESNIKYLKPVTTDIETVASFSDEIQIARFTNVYKRKGISRVILDVFIYQDEEVAVHFSGRYVIHR